MSLGLATKLNIISLNDNTRLSGNIPSDLSGNKIDQE